MAAAGSSTPITSICAVITGSSASAMKPPPSRTMRAAFEAAAMTDGSSTAIGTRIVLAVDQEVEADAERQRVDADRVLDHPIGGLGVEAAAVERPHVLLRQVRAQAQLAPALVDGEAVETRDARAVGVRHARWCLSELRPSRPRPRAAVVILRISRPSVRRALAKGLRGASIGQKRDPDVAAARARGLGGARRAPGPAPPAAASAGGHDRRAPRRARARRAPLRRSGPRRASSARVVASRRRAGTRPPWRRGRARRAGVAAGSRAASALDGADEVDGRGSGRRSRTPPARRAAGPSGPDVGRAVAARGSEMTPPKTAAATSAPEPRPPCAARWARSASANASARSDSASTPAASEQRAHRRPPRRPRSSRGRACRPATRAPRCRSRARRRARVPPRSPRGGRAPPRSPRRRAASTGAAPGTNRPVDPAIDGGDHRGARPRARRTRRSGRACPGALNSGARARSCLLDDARARARARRSIVRSTPGTAASAAATASASAARAQRLDVRAGVDGEEDGRPARRAGRARPRSPRASPGSSR